MVSPSSAGQPLFVYVGTYTDAHMGRAEGVYVYRLDPMTGALAHEQTVAGIANPSFLALDPGGRALYAVNESREGGVTAFARDPESGHLTPRNRQAAHGVAPCHLSIHEGHVLVANYGNGSIAALPIRPDGQLDPATAVVQHEGSSVHPRQAGPHAHMILPDPSGRVVLAVDLGLDQLLAYRLDAATGELAPNEPASAYRSPRPGAGPRQVAFHPNERFAFVLNELDSTVTACDYDAAGGSLRPRQTLSTLPDDFAGQNTCAHIVVAPAGRFLYASNRGHHSIAIVAIDETSGELRVIGHEPTGGRTPRGFGIDPAGEWLLAGNQDTDTIVSFRIDPQSGLLAASGEMAQVPSPVCVVFG